MKTIKLKSMKLRYFKGARNVEIDFSNETNIFGANATGKTTIKDAFDWIITDKDSTGRKDFEIKTLDENNIAIPQVDHEVEVVLNVDGNDLEIRKVYSEKWTKKRGSSEPEFTGHETTYFWNGVPMRQKDYQANIAEICDEYIFKIITSPEAFNDLHWEKRRNILLEMAGDISDDEIAGDNKNYINIVKQLRIVKSEEDYKKKLNASVKKQKDQLKLIPARIDEVEKSKPTPLMWSDIENSIKSKQEEISKIDDQIGDSTKAYQAELNKINAHNRHIFDVRRKIDNLKYEAERQAQKEASSEGNTVNNLLEDIREQNNRLKRIENAKLSNESSVIKIKQTISNIESEMSSKRSEWQKVNAEHYHGDESCPTCKQHLPKQMIEEVKDEFNAKKQTRLNRITDYGKKMSNEKAMRLKELQDLENSANNYSSEIDQIKSIIDGLENEVELSRQDNEMFPKKTVEELTKEKLSENQEYLSLVSELKNLEANVTEVPKVDNSALKQQKQTIQTEIDSLRNDLNKKKLIDQSDKRIEDLKEEQKKLAQEISNVDRDLFALEEFMKLKVEEIERRVRDKFQFVSFKMFREQINGGLKPTCETLIDGVPISDANTAGKINAGLDIINALSKFYGVTAPVFLDNRESVTEILNTDAQIINLIVSPKDPVLRIEEAKETSNQLPIFN